MGNNVTIQFDAQTAQYVQNVLKAKEAFEATANSARASGDKLAKSGDAMSASIGALGKLGEKNFGALTSAAMGAVGGFNVVQSGINILISSYEKWSEKIKEVDAAQQKLNQTSARLSSNSGNAGMGPEMRRRLENMEMPGVTQEQRMDLYKKAQENMPGAKPESLFTMVKAAGGANAAGKDPAALLGTMTNMSHLFPKLTPDELRDKSNAYMEENAGRELDKSTMNAAMRFQLTGAGTADEGLGQALALEHSGASPQTLGKLVDKLAKVKHMHVHGKADERKKQKRNNQFAAMSMADRFKTITQDREAGSDLLDDQDMSELFPSNSKMAAANEFNPDEITGKITNAKGSYDRSSKKRQGDSEYTQDLVVETMEEQARMAKMNKLKGVERKFRQVKAFLQKRGDSGALIEKFDTIIRAGNFATNADPVGMLPKEIAVDFQTEVQSQENQINKAGVFSAAAGPRMPDDNGVTPYNEMDRNAFVTTNRQPVNVEHHEEHMGWLAQLNQTMKNLGQRTELGGPREDK